MKVLAFALSTLLAAPLAPAYAQTPAEAGAAARQVYDWCLKLDTGSVSECACVSGFYAGATDADAFQMIATSLQFFNKDGQVADFPGLQAALATRKSQLGMSDARFSEIVDKFADLGALGEKADSVCTPIEEHASDAEQ